MTEKLTKAKGTRSPSEAWRCLLHAAETLLGAREDQMLTALEWQALRLAVTACRHEAECGQEIGTSGPDTY